MKISVDDLEKRVIALLTQRGFSQSDALIISAPILWAVTHGNNQGLLKFVGEPALQKDCSQRPISVIKETACAAWLDGGEHNAMLVVKVALEKIRALLRKSAIAVVGMRGTHSSSGALAYYTEQLANDGYVSIMISRTPPTVAPFGSIEPLFGTNPLSISFPTMTQPVTFDMATAAIAWYGLIEASAAGEQVDSTKVIDALGNPTSDPDVVLKDGMVLPFDRGHKGSGIAMAVEILAGPLLGASFCEGKGEWGNAIIAIDPDMFVGRTEFKTACSAVMERLKGAKVSNGQAVRLPGERANAFHSNVQATGTIEVPDYVFTKLGWS